MERLCKVAARIVWRLARAAGNSRAGNAEPSGQEPDASQASDERQAQAVRLKEGGPAANCMCHRPNAGSVRIAKQTTSAENEGGGLCRGESPPDAKGQSAAVTEGLTIWYRERHRDRIELAPEYGALYERCRAELLGGAS